MSSMGLGFNRSIDALMRMAVTQRSLPVSSARFLATQLHELGDPSAAVRGGQHRAQSEHSPAEGADN